MAYIFLTDGAPEAEEYESNYLYFNESNTAAVAEIERLLVRRKEDPTVINKLVEVCRESFEINRSRRKVFSSLKASAGSYLKKMRGRFNNLKYPPKVRLGTTIVH